MSTADDEERAAGVYVHVPFCRRRCPYCDFAFEVRPADPRFAHGVVDELGARAGELRYPPSTLSFGGGTPSSVDVDALAEIIAAVRALGLPADAEISLEVNPEDVVDAGALVRAGFTRASLGVQSFDDDVLAYLGRAHDGRRARNAIAACVDAGLRVGVDLIVGVPGDDDARLVDDVEAIAASGAAHVSAYLLTVEPSTPLVQLIAAKKRDAVDDDAQADAYERVQALLVEHGFAQYEISSYARPGQESVHNRLYWGGAPYLGVGPSAHSMRRLDDGRVVRRHTTARFDAWIADPRCAAHEDELLDAPHALREAVAFGLRDLQKGVSLDALARRHGIADVAPLVHALSAAGDDVRFVGGRAFLTAKGARFADRVARAVLDTGAR